MKILLWNAYMDMRSYLCNPFLTVPVAPSNLQVTQADAISATIVWTAPPPNVNSPLSPIVSYLLVLSEQQFNLPILSSNVTTNTHTFTGLQEFNRYTCMIAAENSVGQGPFSSTTFNTSQAGMSQAGLLPLLNIRL